MKQLLISLFIFSISITISAQNLKFTYIPSGTIHIFPFNYDVSDTFIQRPKTISVRGFELSRQITLRNYKLFLQEQKKELKEDEYLKLLPDSTIGSPEKYQQYLSEKKYEKYPVVGISWESAMKYCYWKTVKDNPNDKITFHYQLPTNYEWTLAKKSIEKAKAKTRKKMIKKIGWNSDYANWILEPFRENAYSFLHDLNPDLRYDSREEKSDKRTFRGNSFLFQLEKSNDVNQPKSIPVPKSSGFNHVSFRFTKVYMEENESMTIEEFKSFWKNFDI